MRLNDDHTKNDMGTALKPISERLDSNPEMAMVLLAAARAQPAAPQASQPWNRTMVCLIPWCTLESRATAYQLMAETGDAHEFGSVLELLAHLCRYTGRRLRLRHLYQTLVSYVCLPRDCSPCHVASEMVPLSNSLQLLLMVAVNGLHY